MSLGDLVGAGWTLIGDESAGEADHDGRRGPKLAPESIVTRHLEAMAVESYWRGYEDARDKIADVVEYVARELGTGDFVRISKLIAKVRDETFALPGWAGEA